MPRRSVSIQYLMGLVLVVAVILAVLQFDFDETGVDETSVVYGAFAVWLMAPWVVEPIRLHATHWVKTTLSYEPFELDDPELPLAVVAFLHQTEPALRSLGFELLGRFRRPGSTGPVKATGHIALFEHPITHEQARVLATVAPARLSLTLVFRTEYNDGTHFSTSNVRVPGILPSARHRPGSMAFPQVRGVRLLYALHARRADPEGRVDVGIDDPMERLERDVHLEHSAWLKAGYYRPEPGSTRWRNTWKGAFLMTWKVLWPVPQTRLAWRQWRAARFLRSIDVEEAT